MRTRFSSRRDRTRLGASGAARSALVLIGVLSFGGPSVAFEYYEHRGVTDAVLDELCPKRAKSKHVCEARKALLEIVRRRDERLTTGDFVAMAGDHSVSPPSLVWRFFIARQGTTYIPNLNILHLESPENVEQESIDLRLFLDTIEALKPPAVDQAGSWRPCALAIKTQYDKKMMGSAASFISAAKQAKLGVFRNLLKKKLTASRLMPDPPVDPNYISNAAHNASHFRIPATISSEQLWARTYYRLDGDPRGLVSRSKPALHALSFYGDLHGGALLLMRAAGRTKAKIERRHLTAAALLLESFSLHFLQDSVAAGHLGGEAPHHLGYPAIFLKHDSDRVASAGSLFDSSTRKELHDNGNVRGRGVILTVEAGREVCGARTKGRAKVAEIEGSSRLQTIFGDGALLCGTPKSQPWLTRALVEAVTRASFRELERAYADELLDHAAPTLLDDPEGFKEVTPCKIDQPPDNDLEIDQLHTNACQWWESHPKKKFEKAVALRRVFAAGYYKAVEMLPMPAHDDGGKRHEKKEPGDGVTKEAFCRARGY